MLLLLLFIFLAVSGSPHIDCFVDNQECEISANTFHTFLGISSTTLAATTIQFQTAAFSFLPAENEDRARIAQQDQVRRSALAVSPTPETLPLTTSLTSLEVSEMSLSVRSCASPTVDATCTPTMTARILSSQEPAYL